MEAGQREGKHEDPIQWLIVQLRDARVRLGVLTGVLCLALVVLGMNVAFKPGYVSTLKWVATHNPDEWEYAANPIAAERVIEIDGKPHLWGGDDPNDHFDLTASLLEPRRLRYGIGREAFPALTEPEFEAAAAANAWLRDEDRVLAVRVGEEIKVYPVNLLMRHEVVNDVIGDRPIFAAYCVLADLGAVYERDLEGREFTFALSGYTYSEPDVWDGLDAFVLWDRETESLWWPPLGKAVSGPMIETPMKVLDKALWSQTTWGEIKSQFPDVVVLKSDQDFPRPESWPQYTDIAAREPDETSEAPPTAIAPRWGENAQL